MKPLECEGICIVCDIPAVQKCSGCQAVYYCGKDHQKKHWKEHKHACSPVRVKEDPVKGRYLEAIREIKPGDVILKEKPLISGPTQITPPVCLGCYKELEEGCIVTCELCGWPFCSKECTKSQDHKPECFYTQQRGEKITISTFGVAHPNYQCLTPLRCLYQRDHNPPLWQKISNLQASCDQRRGTEKWESDRKMVAGVIWKLFRLEKVFSEEEIMKCCGILQINGHEVPLSEPEHVAVYDKVSMIEHNCRANAYKSFTSQGEIMVSCGTSIPAGAAVSVCYSDPAWGTAARRHHTALSWLFECGCARCADTTELGTYCSALKCRNKDCKGFLLPSTFLVPVLHASTTIPDAETHDPDGKPWICNQCKDQVSDTVIQKLLEDIGRELSNMPKGDPDACERFISHCSAYLHPNHYYMTDVSLALATMIGNTQGPSSAGDPDSQSGLAGETDDRLQLKLQLCKKLDELFEILAPAEWRTRGLILFELHAALAETGRRKALRDGPPVLLGYLTEARKVLQKCALFLHHEPPEMPEGKLYVQAKKNLMYMEQMIQNIGQTLPAPI